MRRGDKSKYTAKQAHKADDIAQGYEARGISEREGRAPRLGDRQQRRRTWQEIRIGPKRRNGRSLGSHGRNNRRRGSFRPPRREARQGSDGNE
jgi:hypothetical protein